MDTWAVVTLARAPRPYIDRFIAHHLELGANRIYLFFDDPQMAWPIRDSRVKAVVCDGDFWKDKRPDSVEARQRAVCRLTLRWCKCDWIAFIDSDELIHGDAVGSALARMPADVLSVHMPPFEAVYDREPGPDDAYGTRFFKQPVSWPEGRHPILWELFGTLARGSRGGLWGHDRGKSFTRVKLADGWLPIHGYKTPIGETRINVRIDGLVLLHFDALTYADWKEKCLRRIDGEVSFVTVTGDPRRAIQLAAIAEARATGGEQALHTLYCRMNVLDDDRLHKAIAAGLVVEIERGAPRQSLSA